MIETKPNTQRFRENIDQVSKMYKEAFAGFPWFEDLSAEEVSKRLDSNMTKGGFESFIAEDENGEIIGGLWFDSPTLEQLQAERGEKLADFTRKLCEASSTNDLIWERELMVRPDCQRQKIATRLRMAFLTYLSGKYPNGVFVLTRMRDDNIGTLKIAQRLGYQRTGIKMPSSKNPNVYHEFWYKHVNSKEEQK